METIEAYKTGDGKIFTDEEAARMHERRTLLENLLDKELSFEQEQRRAIVNALTRNREQVVEILMDTKESATPQSLDDWVVGTGLCRTLQADALGFLENYTLKIREELKRMDPVLTGIKEEVFTSLDKFAAEKGALREGTHSMILFKIIDGWEILIPLLEEQNDV
jgi:hypothetical protein